jgi:hypothetical protein
MEKNYLPVNEVLNQEFLQANGLNQEWFVFLESGKNYNLRIKPK